jgi:MYXO-CTERM domain-containing protein
VTASATRDLGSFCVGEPTATALVSLTASGTASVALPSAPVMALGDASPFQLTPVAPSVFPYALLAGARATANVTAKRQAVAGTMTDDVAWSDDVPGDQMPHTTVMATFIDDGGAISPGSVDFGSAAIYLSEPTAQIITIQNCGTQAMSLAAPTISPAGQFFTVGTLPQQLLPAQSATFSVGFGPVAVGDFTATLSVPKTIGTDTTPLQVMLTGEGVITTPQGDDAGPGTHETHTGCGCQTDGRGDPLGVLAVLAALALSARRRRGSS